MILSIYYNYFFRALLEENNITDYSLITIEELLPFPH